MYTYDDGTLNKKNFVLYAAKHYNNPRVLNLDEFYEDFARFKYLKKLFTKYKNKQILQHRLILNHLINIFNVFETYPALKMCFFKIEEEHWSALKTFLLYLNYIKDDDLINIPTDLYITRQLQQI